MENDGDHVEQEKALPDFAQQKMKQAMFGMFIVQALILSTIPGLLLGSGWLSLFVFVVLCIFVSSQSFVTYVGIIFGIASGCAVFLLIHPMEGMTWIYSTVITAVSTALFIYANIFISKLKVEQT